MAEYTKSLQLNSKTAKIIAVAVVVGLVGFVIFAKVTGKSLHIKTGTIRGQNATVTEYLDNQDSIEGTVTTSVSVGTNTVYIVGGNIGVDVSLVLRNTNHQYPVSHFIRGDIKTGTRVKAIVRKSDPVQNLGGYNIDHWYEVWPSDPFYIAAQ